MDFLVQTKKDFPEEFPKLMKRLDRIAKKGIEGNEEHFKWVRQDIGEIKTKRLRIYCFRDHTKPKTLILTHGCKRESVEKELTQEIEKAERICAEYKLQLERK